MEIRQAFDMEDISCLVGYAMYLDEEETVSVMKVLDNASYRTLQLMSKWGLDIKNQTINSKIYPLTWGGSYHVGDGMVVFAERQGVPFMNSDKYGTTEEMAHEFKRRYRSLLGKDFDYAEHLVWYEGIHVLH